MKCVIVIPTYDESHTLERLISAIFSVMDDCQVVIVDDDSPDGTGAIAERLAEEEPGKLHVIHRQGRMGLGSAYKEGFKYALEHTDAQYIFEMDADFSHDPKYLLDFLEKAQVSDMVVGSRYYNGISIVNWPLPRLIISKFGTWYARRITGLPLTDATSGFKCFKRQVLERIDFDKIRSNGYAFQIETSYWAWLKGFRIEEIPIIFVDRDSGQSKMSFKIAMEAAYRVVRLALENLFKTKPRGTVNLTRKVKTKRI